MHDHQICEMCYHLVKAGLISDPVQAQKVLADYWADKIAVVWGVEDVKSTMAEWHEVEIDAISDETALEVLQTVFENHDCNYGINWETIRATALDMKRLDEIGN